MNENKSCDTCGTPCSWFNDPTDDICAATLNFPYWQPKKQNNHEVSKRTRKGAHHE